MIRMIWTWRLHLAGHTPREGRVDRIDNMVLTPDFVGIRDLEGWSFVLTYQEMRAVIATWVAERNSVRLERAA